MIKKDSRIVKLNDALFYKIMHQKWVDNEVDYCIICDKMNNRINRNIECAHLISKSHLLTRWNSYFVMQLCADHHRLSSEFSAHKTPKKFEEFLKEYLTELWDFMETARRMIVKRNELPWTLQEKHAELKNEWKQCASLPF